MDDFQIQDGVLIKYNGSDTVVTIPNGVTSIGNLAFQFNMDLKRIIIPNTVTSIGEWAFRGCVNLQDINIPDGISIVRYSTFCTCSSLKEIILPNSVIAIGGEAFSNCSSLEKINIPNGVNDIGYNVFEKCDNLKSINMDMDKLIYLKKLNYPFNYDDISNGIVHRNSNILSTVSRYYYFFDLKLISQKIVEILNSNPSKDTIFNSLGFYIKNDILKRLPKHHYKELFKIIRDNDAKTSFSFLINTIIVPKLLKSDLSVIEDIMYFDFNESEVNQLLDVSIRNHFTMCTTELLNYKNTHFGFNSNSDEFSID